jgi:ABC-type dipeptide/oligopeptide/nickel transport system permease component
VRRFLLRRLSWFALTLFAVVTLAFALMRGVRGGPFDGERPLPPAIERNLRAAYHLDWPLWKQYLEYVGPLELGEHGARALGGDGTHVFGGVLSGDFGPSFRYRDFTVNDILGQSLPISLTLGTLALLFALSVGIPAGLASALLRGRALDVALRLATSLGIALPSFVLASALLFVFALAWPLFPVAGYGSWRHLVLPALALGAPFAAYAARLVRAAALEVLAQDYVRTARDKGLPESRVLARHVLPGALLPLLSWLGPAAAGVLTGSLVVERIFAITGTGSHFVNSALNRDYTLAMGVTILYTTLVYGFNLLVDLSYGWIDPRMRAGEQE